MEKAYVFREIPKLQRPSATGTNRRPGCSLWPASSRRSWCC